VPHVNWYTPLAIMSGYRFLATNSNNVNESRAWLAMIVVLALMTGARLTNYMAASTNNNDGSERDHSLLGSGDVLGACGSPRTASR
jgi:hypothetical protein